MTLDLGGVIAAELFLLVTATRSDVPPDYVCQEPDYSGACMYIETVAVDRAVIKKAQKSCFLFFASHPEIALLVPIAGAGSCEKSEVQRGKSLHFLFCKWLLCLGLELDCSTIMLFSLC